jgi:Zn-dependent peptidase ImmA (M78 family)
MSVSYSYLDRVKDAKSEKLSTMISQSLEYVSEKKIKTKSTQGDKSKKYEPPKPPKIKESATNLQEKPTLSSKQTIKRRFKLLARFLQ